MASADKVFQYALSRRYDESEALPLKLCTTPSIPGLGRNFFCVFSSRLKARGRGRRYLPFLPLHLVAPRPPRFLREDVGVGG
jgi:hypothetical protein